MKWLQKERKKVHTHVEEQVCTYMVSIDNPVWTVFMYTLHKRDATVAGTIRNNEAKSNFGNYCSTAASFKLSELVEILSRTYAFLVQRDSV